MKHYLRFLAAAAAAAAVCILLLFAAGKTFRTKSRDPVQLNDIVQTVREHLAQPESLDTLSFDTELLVFRQDGSLLYASAQAPGDIRTANDALRSGCLCMAMTENGRFLGTVALPDPVTDGYKRLHRRLILTGTAILLTVLMLLAVCGLYIRGRIVLPFRRMQAFAGRIAQGQLDDPLLTEQSGLFGSFSESFDMMREELAAARRREEALRMREKELAASLSHDIKTPVTGIKLICELLTVQTEDPYTRGKIEQINQKAEQIHLLADDLLTAALDELGEMQLQCTDEPSAALQTLLAEHDSRGLIRAADAPECMVRIDKSRFSQVLANIISNSYKYAGTPIEIRYEFCGRFLRMDIADSGGGIPEDELDLITTKYYRGKANSGGKDGTGLGLYISSELMKRMHGELLCENRAGGLTVTLMLPLS